ncbi:hypothetical protein JW921_04340, partial [Candidatus Fermentibacterales bacterium]|nr:hypothetical protein [Candidatus Fermentibacterales bacterium]
DGRVVNIEVTGTQGLEEVIDVIEEELLLLDFGPCAEQLENIPVSAPLLLMPPSDSGAEGTEWH